MLTILQDCIFLETKVTIVLLLSENDRMKLACHSQILFKCRGSAFEQVWKVNNNIAFDHILPFLVQYNG